MTHSTIYYSSLAILVGATFLTFIAINLPSWAKLSMQTSDGRQSYSTIGLHVSCASPGHCQPFPPEDECHDSHRYFCFTWRSICFLMWISLIADMVTLVGISFVNRGGKRRRQRGWNLIPALLSAGSILQCICTLAVARILNYDKRFEGWTLGLSWILCTVAWVISIALALIIFGFKSIFEPDGDYELIPN